MPETNFFWDPVEDNIIQERDETGAITAEYATEPYLYGNLISQNRGGVESQYHFDSQGSTLALTDDNQQVTDTYAYSAFGEVTEHTGNSVNPFQYIGNRGYWKTSSSNYSVRTHTLSPTYGRWLSVGPGERYAASASFAAVTITTPSFCRIQLACLRLGVGRINVGPKHCGIEINDSSGITRYHVDPTIDGSCYIADYRVEFGPFSKVKDYYIVATWGDPTGWACNCIHAAVRAFNSVARSSMPYHPIPFNNDYITDCKTCTPHSTCNSNYATHCVMKTCGLDYLEWILTPVGWNHRMKTCLACSDKLRITKEHELGFTCRCGCDGWIEKDQGWCSDPPSSPKKPDYPSLTPF